MLLLMFKEYFGVLKNTRSKKVLIFHLWGLYYKGLNLSFLGLVQNPLHFFPNVVSPSMEVFLVDITWWYQVNMQLHRMLWDLM